MRKLAICCVVVVGLVIAACGGDDDDSTQATASPTVTASAATTAAPNTASPAATEDYIGTATMADDGTITLHLFAEGPNGEIGEGTFDYPPDDDQYQYILDHVGPLEPGQTVSVLPFPE